MTTWVLVGLAGGLGALCRLLVDVAVTSRMGGWPWGTFAVNMTGSLAAGAVVGLGIAELVGPAAVRVVAGGFLGAYTTFSTHALESYRLLAAQKRVGAIANLTGSALLGTALAALGLALPVLLG